MSIFHGMLDLKKTYCSLRRPATSAFYNLVSAEDFQNHISTAEAPLIDRDQ